VKSSASSSRAALARTRSTGGPEGPQGPGGSDAGLFQLLAEHGHEQVSFWSDPASGYRGIIAIHDTTLGPGLGGTRFWPYGSDRDALLDVLRLARSMTYKNALAGLTSGGGKSVIVGDQGTPRREALLRAHGRHIQSLHGRYITAEDVGTSPADMEIIRAETPYVTGLIGKSGDPSPVTAYGVYRGMQACARYRWGTDALGGRTVAIQGLGHVGYALARLLRRDGATLVVTDLDAARVRRAVEELGAQAVEPDEIYAARAEIFAPCALGGVINDTTLPRLRAEIVAGGANNQLAEDRHGDLLAERGVLYAPDFAINGGGVINLSAELNGWSAEYAMERTGGIYDTVLTVFAAAKQEGISSARAAERLAERRIAAAKTERGSVAT